MRGRKPDAPELRLIKGSKRVRGLVAKEPVAPAAGEPAMPVGFSARQARKWTEIVSCMREMGTLGRESGDLIRLYVEACIEAEDARERVREDGPIVLAPRTGVPMHNMYRAVARQAEAAMVKLAAELGLTPSSRARVPAKRQEASNPFLKRRS